MTEIAYLKSGFVRIVQRSHDGWYEVQTMRFRGEGKDGNGNPIWARLYGVHDLNKAIQLLESYA